MDPDDRPRRFIIVPRPAAGESPSPAQTARLLQRRLAPAAAGAPPLKIVNRSPADGSLLVAADSASIEQIKARAPAGARVFEEHWYRLDRPARPWYRLQGGLQRPRPRAATASDWVVQVRTAGPASQPLADARVTLILDSARGIGTDAVTDRLGRARFELGRGVRRLEVVHVDPLHGGWPVARVDLPVTPDGLLVEVPPIDLAAADVRTLVYGEAPVAAGQGVKVGVVDTGVGPHAALTLAGGRNTTEESPRRYRDENGHGTHVAGVIAAQAAGPRRGEASAVGLYAYRIFQSGDEYASTFAISAAIKQAALDGCDLVNLSIGGGDADGSVRDAIDYAWSQGCVCLAATGNDGRGQVDYPARYPKSLAVSAIGLTDSWPAASSLGWTLAKPRGKAIAGRETFLAAFSNRGAKVALTAPGVAVVSTLFGDRYGVMSGTSMATPIATGVLARRLAASPVFGLPRDAARAEAIVTLALDAAEDLGLPATMQGRGLAR